MRLEPFMKKNNSPEASEFYSKKSTDVAFGSLIGLFGSWGKHIMES